jgi:hypothetical protein
VRYKKKMVNEEHKALRALTRTAALAAPPNSVKILAKS